MVTKIKTAVLVSLLVFSAPGYSADENGLANAIGISSCGEWVKERTADSVLSWQDKTWIAGYLTAYNRQTPDTWDIQGNTDIESIFLWLDKYCRENPLENLGGAMADLTEELYPNRTVKRTNN